MKWFVRDEAYLLTAWLKAWMQNDGEPQVRTLATYLCQGREVIINDRLMNDCCKGLKRFSYQSIYAKLRRLSSNRLFLGRSLTYVEKQTVWARFLAGHSTTELLARAGTSTEGQSWQFKGLEMRRLSPAIEWIERRDFNLKLRHAILENLHINPQRGVPISSKPLRRSVILTK